MVTDLFGEEAKPLEFTKRGRIIRRNGPKGGKFYVKPSGYVYTPGTGPTGENCGTCKHNTKRDCAAIFYKCKKAKKFWTNSRRTDILLESPACREWESRKK